VLVLLLLRPHHAWRALVIDAAVGSLCSVRGLGLITSDAVSLNHIRHNSPCRRAAYLLGSWTTGHVAPSPVCCKQCLCPCVLNAPLIFTPAAAAATSLLRAGCVFLLL
jgi:hypothetical protein